ncbi:hypothetical protein ANCCAN_24496, partial [Ancylostoma caninum]
LCELDCRISFLDSHAVEELATRRNLLNEARPKSTGKNSYSDAFTPPQQTRLSEARRPKLPRPKENLDEDESGVCGYCEPTVPQKGLTNENMDWMQCETCLIWVRNDCIRQRECDNCDEGTFEVVQGADEAVEEDETVSVQGEIIER